MTIEEIKRRIADKEKKLQDVNKKIAALQKEIETLQNKKQASVKSGSSTEAIEYQKQMRDKEDELEILRQVLSNVQGTPAISQEEILEVWGNISKELITEWEKEVKPELEAAYKCYCKVADRIVDLKRKAQKPASELESLASSQNIEISLNNPFKGIETHQFYIDRPILTKVSCLYNPIMDAPISRPIDYESNKI